MTVTRRAIRRVLCAASGMALCCTVAAAEWRVSSGARIDAGYADNPRLLEEGGVSSEHATGELSATLRRRTERSELSLEPRLRSERYENDVTLDADYRYLDARARFSSERVEWSGSANLTHDTTLVSELATTGIVQVDRKREAMSVSFGPTIAVGERTSAGAQVYWLDTHYVDAEASGLSDYEYGSASLFGSYQLSELSRLTLTAQGGALRVPDRSNAGQQDGAVRLGWSYSPAPLWSVEVSAGPSYARSDFSSDEGAVFSANVQRAAERWTVALSAGRETTPTGRGVLMRRDRVGIDLTHGLTERLSLDTAIGIVRTEDLLPPAGVAADVLEYGRINVRLNWMPFERWALSLSAGAATQSRSWRDDSAENYKVSLGIVWNGRTQLL